jgi:hypothetical protein
MTMNMVNTFSIDFIGRLLKNDKSTICLYVKITVNGTSKEISLKTLLDPNDWNSNKEMVMGKSIEVKATNDYIDKVRFKITEAYRLLQDEEEK